MRPQNSPKILLIDNYDSFTYNLVQAFLVLGAEVDVHRNDAITVEEALALAPSHLVISPGPGTPHDAGVSMRMIQAFAARIPILGVCLGHQSLVEVFGGKVVRAARLMHGKVSPVVHDGQVRCGALSLADRGRGQHSGRARGHVANRGRRNHGGPAQIATDRRRAISPGKCAHTGRPDSPGKFPQDLNGE
jgi:anthranilate synthase/aminodeoxychorismate synthase-like glutamine amidotransferase